MLKNKTKIIAILLILFVLLSSSFVFADNETDDLDETQVTTSEQISEEDSYKKSDVYLIDQEVTIDYIVDGNLFVMADTVTIDAQIGGDAFIMAKNIIVGEHGYIYSNLFALANFY